MQTDKNIKIFVDAHCFDTEYQGTQSFLFGLYNALLQYHPELDIYMGCYYTDRIQKAFPALDAAHILPYKTLRPAALRFITDIPRLLKQHKFDFAHFQYIAPAQQPPCRFIVTLHDVLFYDFPKEFSWAFRNSRKKLFGSSIKQAAVKTTVSAYAQGRIAHHYELPAHQLPIVPNIIQPLPGNALGKEAAAEHIKAEYGVENYLLYVSRMEPRKNHLLLLQAWQEMELYQQGIALVFIGKKQGRMGPLMKAIAQLPPAAQPFFHHFEQVNRASLTHFLRATRLFVYPSLAEGFGIPPLEAAAAGIPVLCSNATAMQAFDFFGDGLFDPRDKQAVKQKLGAMLHTPPGEDQLAAIAEAVQQRYGPRHCADLFYKLLNGQLP
jgi:glycosyltransferase involved in cell wall biosynthesis